MGSMTETRGRSPFDIYSEPGVEWQVRFLGTHLHPGSEEATVALAERAAHFGLAEGGVIVDLASALGGPARFLARRFAATVICIDFNPRMHVVLARSARTEGLARRCLPVLACAERLPLATASCDGAWSQDSLCHMNKPIVIGEVARVLRAHAIVAFTDFIARSGFTHEDARALADHWAWPALLRLPQYTALLDEHGFEVLLAEDRTRVVAGQRPDAGAGDQEQWDRDFATRHGEAVLEQQRSLMQLWLSLLLAERAGYGMFIARRRPT